MNIYFRRYWVLLAIAIIAIFSIITMSVVLSLANDSVGYIPENDANYCYDVSELKGDDNATRFKNVSLVHEQDIVSRNITLSAVNGGKIIMTKPHQQINHLLEDRTTAEGDSYRLVVFCISNIDSKKFAEKAKSLNIYETEGGTEIIFNKPHYSIYAYNDMGQLNNIRMQYYIVLTNK